MRNLVRPSWDGLETFDKIITSKRNPEVAGVLNGVRSKVISAVCRYRACSPHLEDFGRDRISQAEKQALLDCYESKNRVKVCTEMLAELQQLNCDRVKCPLCGINEQDTWDHYLPKAEFPELAVCVLNLVRVCFHCNNIRKCWLVDKRRSTLHMYYDWIPSEHALLEADVSIGAKGPHAVFRVEATIDSPGFAGLFARHCEELGLLQRFAANGAEKLRDIADALGGRHSRVKSLRRNLEETARRRGNRHGANHWEAALYRGAARADDFIRYLSQGSLS